MPPARVPRRAARSIAADKQDPARRTDAGAEQATLTCTVFQTALGWCCLLTSPRGVRRLTFGHATPGDAREILGLQ